MGADALTEKVAFAAPECAAQTPPTVLDAAAYEIWPDASMVGVHIELIALDFSAQFEAKSESVTPHELLDVTP